MSEPRLIFVVAVCHRLTPFAMIERLEALLIQCGRSARGVVVSNQASHALDSPKSEMVVIRGSNDHLDFSGYFEGIARLISEHPSAAKENVLFVNDSLLYNHAARTVLRYVLALNGLLANIAIPAIGGKLDPYRSICLHNPWSRHTGYMTTFCFLLNAPAQPLLSGLLADAEAAGVLEMLQPDDPAWATGVERALREQIRAHVVYPGSPYRWVSADDHGAELLRKKARCVYFEHRLSGAVGDGGALVPINSGPRSSLAIAMAETISRWVRVARGASR